MKQRRPNQPLSVRPSPSAAGRKGLALGCVLACAVLLAGCTMTLRDGARLKPLESNVFFENSQSARPLVDNTVARGYLWTDPELYRGQTADGQLVEVFPFEITPAILERGQERYNIYCSPCHGMVGDGQGLVVQRGFKQPSSFHIDRLREAPVGYYYSAITHGFGAMYSYASRVEPEDRWAIIAYIRALQLSQNATLSDVPPDLREDLLTGPER